MKKALSARDVTGLMAEAEQTLAHAYAPYSHYKVVAALWGADGKVYVGCNVENGSYGLTLCAERVAVGVAVAAGCRRFKALAIMAQGKGRLAQAVPSPCGACRQVLAEFCDARFPIYVACRGQKTPRRYRLGQLLPHQFTLA